MHYSQANKLFPTDGYLSTKEVSEMVELMEYEPENLVDLIDISLDSSEDLIQQLVHAASIREGKYIKENSHSLKSSSAQIGAHALSQLCQQLEKLGKSIAENDPQADYETLDTLIAEIKEEHQQFTKSLLQWKTLLTS